MSPINTFVQKFSAEYAAKRNQLSNKFALEKERILDEYTKQVNHATALEDHYTALVAPLMAGLSAFPDNVVINHITFNGAAPPNVAITAGLDVSMASLLMDYPAIPFVLEANGAMRGCSAETQDEAVYSGIFVSTKMQCAQWQTSLNGRLVNISCTMEGLTPTVWNNPADTGVPVASIRVSDIGGSNEWRILSNDGADYWVQPASTAAMNTLNQAKKWQEQTQLSYSLREEFNSRLKEFPALRSPQALLVMNALFAWAKSGQELPVKEDFSAWAAPRGNVLVMHSAQDWDNLLGESSKERSIPTPAQEKIHMISARLPNIWRFIDEKGIAIICDAMAEVQIRLQASQAPTI